MTFAALGVTARQKYCIQNFYDGWSFGSREVMNNTTLKEFRKQRNLKKESIISLKIVLIEKSN